MKKGNKMSSYPHVMARMFNTPLAVHPDKAAVFAAALGSRLGLDDLTIEQSRQALSGVGNVMPTKLAAVPGAIESRKPYVVTDRGVAVVHIHGTLVHRAASANPPSMLWSYGEIENMIMDAATDSTIRGILYDADSGGGECSGAFDCADVLRKARDLKPIWAIADEHAYSAAYALASTAHRLVLPRTGGVGSIGVIAMHMDRSARDRAEGFQYTTIFSGERKNDFNPHEELGDEARKILQADVRRNYDLFVDLVTLNRPDLSADQIRAMESGYFVGQDAVDAGLADAVMPFRQVLAEFSEFLDAPHSGVAMAGSAGAASALANSEPPQTMETPMKTKGTKDDNPALTAEGTAPETAAAGEEQQVETGAEAATETPTPEAVKPDNDGGAEVIDLEAVRGEGYAQAAEVVSLCALANMPEKAADFIANKTSVADVRANLQTLKADADADTVTDGHHDNLGGAEQPVTLSASEIYGRRRKASMEKNSRR